MAVGQEISDGVFNSSRASVFTKHQKSCGKKSKKYTVHIHQTLARGSKFVHIFLALRARVESAVSQRIDSDQVFFMHRFPRFYKIINILYALLSEYFITYLIRSKNILLCYSFTDLKWQHYKFVVFFRPSTNVKTTRIERNSNRYKPPCVRFLM